MLFLKCFVLAYRVLVVAAGKMHGGLRREYILLAQDYHQYLAQLGFNHLR